LPQISPFKDISQNQKKIGRKNIFPNGFLSQEIGRNHTIVLPSLWSYLQRNYNFWDDFWICETFKKEKFGNIFWCNKWNGKLNIPHFFECRQDDRMLTFSLVSCIFLHFLKIFWGLSQQIKSKVDIPSSFAW